MPLSGLVRLLIPALLSLPAQAAETIGRESLWEAGLVAGGVYGPDYPAAGKSHLNGLALPYAIYRGRLLKADQEGVRGQLSLAERVELTLGFGAAFPARSEDNPDRVGMDDLGYLVEVGPSLNYRLLTGPRTRLKLMAQTRAVFAVSGDGRGYQGLVLTPELNFRQARFLDTRSQLLASIAVRFGQDGLNQRFYQVDARDIRPGRPAYQAHDGYLQSALNLGLRLPLAERLNLFVGGQLILSQGSANEDSPLYRRDFNYSIGAAIQYRLFRSKRLVFDQD